MSPTDTPATKRRMGRRARSKAGAQAPELPGPRQPEDSHACSQPRTGARADDSPITEAVEQEVMTLPAATINTNADIFPGSALAAACAQHRELLACQLAFPACWQFDV